MSRWWPVGQTALNLASGARGRWASIFSGVWLLAILIVFSGIVGKVVIPTLAAVLIFAAVTSLRSGAIGTIWRTGLTSQIAFAATLVATLFLPVAAAVGIGVVLSLLLQLNSEAVDLRVVSLVPQPDGHWREEPAPAALPSEAVTMLDIYGSLFYAGAKTLAVRLPDPAGARRPVVVLRLRGRTRLGASSRVVLDAYADRLGRSAAASSSAGSTPPCSPSSTGRAARRSTRTSNLRRHRHRRHLIGSGLPGRRALARRGTGRDAGSARPMRSTLREHRLAVLGVAALLALLVAAAVVLNRIGGSDGFSLASASGGWAYLVVFGLILGDAVVPVLPGETTLNAGATLAAAGSLDLVLVMVAGALGAIVGDSALYWIARLGRRRIRPQVARAESNEKVALALEYMGSSAPVLIVAGRYVPDLRSVVNATMGISEFPYRRFLLWSSIGGALWSVYTVASPT